jgi:nucleoside-diphosphate-sugar epimerase
MEALRNITDEETLEVELSHPYPEDIEVAGRLNGDVLVLGAGGKMGPTLVRRITSAWEAAENPSTVHAVSRWSDRAVRDRVESWGVHTISGDLMDDGTLALLPDCPFVIYMAGTKFGTTGGESLTWAMNAYLPGRVAQRFRDSRIVVFSTGNVYPFVAIDSSGARESDPVGPIGEYAQSCLGRERIFDHFAQQNSTAVCILRLNYAVEPRYGVLLDIAQRIESGEPISVEMGYVNVIWQGDANSVCLRALEHCSVPPLLLNLTGPDILAVRSLAKELGDRLDRKPIITGKERSTALLSDASRCHQLFGKPRVPVSEILDLVARWVQAGMATLGKPTKFEVRDGNF